jgi:uncharacterized protein
MIQPILADRLTEIQHLLQTNRVVRAFAFGSVCTDAFTPESDVDLLIKFEDGLEPITYGNYFFDLLDGLENLLGRSIDLVTEPSVKSPYFRQVLNKTSVLICG